MFSRLWWCQVNVSNVFCKSKQQHRVHQNTTVHWMLPSSFIRKAESRVFTEELAQHCWEASFWYRKLIWSFFFNLGEIAYFNRFRRSRISSLFVRLWIFEEIVCWRQIKREVESRCYSACWWFCRYCQLVRLYSSWCAQISFANCSWRQISKWCPWRFQGSHPNRRSNWFVPWFHARDASCFPR